MGPVLNITLKATWMLARHALPIMLAGGGGNIVITGSVHAVRGYACHGLPGGQGRAAVVHPRAGHRFAPTVRVNTILPGAVLTAAWTGTSDAHMARVADMCPLKRNAAPEEIAQVALFLASPMSSFMTGTSVGGLRGSHRCHRGAREGIACMATPFSPIVLHEHKNTYLFWVIPVFLVVGCLLVGVNIWAAGVGSPGH